MINLVQYPSGDEYISMYEFTEEGDTLVITPSIPALGVLELTQISINQIPTVGAFDVFYRVSTDNGLHWSEGMNTALSPGIKPTQCVLLEITLIKTGSGTSYFGGVEFQFSQSGLPEIPQFYKEHKTLSQIPYYNHSALNWTLNVLQKVYKRGIVPSFIERGENQNWGDEDYINIWWSLIYPMALRIAYAETFSDLLWTPKLLQGFLEQRGLVLGNISGLDELYYLMTHFYDEISKRGTLSIFETEGVRGEFARLIDLKKNTDLFLGLINGFESGWWLNQTSMGGYENTDLFVNYIIAYCNEFGSNQNAYPTTGLVSWIHSLGGGKQLAVNLIGTPTTSGIASEDFSKAIPINPLWNYCIVAELTLVKKQRVRFGASCLDSLGNEVYFKQVNFGERNGFFFDRTLEPGSYKLYGGIFCIGSEQNQKVDGLSLPLIFRENVSSEYIQPYLLCSDAATITEFKICVLRPEVQYLQSTLQKVYNIVCENKNLNLSNKEIETIVKNKLLPLNINYTLNF